jgi:L-amino acid N-acyltransferase YncA
MKIRYATINDLPRIVEIYNASIPSRIATADTAPVTVESRQAWFADFNAEKRPCWVAEKNGAIVGFFSFRSYYGRPAYHATVETAVYIAPEAVRQGVGAALLDHAIASAPACGVKTMLAFIFGHNAPSVSLFQTRGFTPWGKLPQVCEMDGREYDILILGRRVVGAMRSAV